MKVATSRGLPQNTMALKSFAGMKPFDPNLDRFDDHRERLDHFSTANDIKKNKASHLITCLDSTSYRLLKGQVATDKVSAKSYDDLVKVLKDHFCEKPNVIAERGKFYRCRQPENELIAEFAAALWQLSTDWDFKGHQLDEALRDVFALGVKNKTMQRQLHKVKDLTIKSVLEMAQMFKTADKTWKS